MPLPRSALLVRLHPWVFSVLLATMTAATAAPAHRDHRVAAETAYAQRDYTLARAEIERALALRPDSPRYLQNLAALATLLDEPDAAFAALHRLADLGVAADLLRDRDLAALQGSPEWRRIQLRFAANREPRGSLSVLHELPGRAGIYEGIAYAQKTGELYLGDVHERCVWRVDRDGRIVRFTREEDDVFGIFGLAVDESRQALWATTTAVPEMLAYDAELKGFSGLVEFDLASGDVRRVIPLPLDGQEHGLGDLVVAPDGTVYATDSVAPVIWRLAPGAEEFDRAAMSREFISLQGIVLMQGLLIVADYGNGLFVVDPERETLRALPSSAGTTLLGIDGLVSIPGGVIATQNGTEPQRVLHLKLAPDLQSVTAVEVLASGQPALHDLSLITLVDDVPTLIAGAGWEHVDPARASPPAPHAVHILQVPLSSP